MRLRVEIGLARLAGRLSRVTGKGGGTTLPGRVLCRLDRDAVDVLASRLPHGSVLVSATNGKTTTSAMAAEILGPRFRLAHNRAGANLMSGVAAALVADEDAELGLFEVDEAAFPEVAARTRPRVVVLSNLFRDQLDRYGELEIVAERWRAAIARLGDETTAIVNVDDPLLADLVRSREHTVRFGLSDPSVARERLPHAADSKYCVICGTPYTYDATYVGHLGAYRCPRGDDERPPLDVTARSIQLDGLAGSSFDLVTPGGVRRVRIGLPGLYNVYNALAASCAALELGATLDDVEGGLNRFQAAFGRFERIPAGDREVLMLLVKNPAGANEALRTLTDGNPPAVALVALNDDIADGRDVSWIWDVDFEPLAASLERLVATGSRAYELALRFKYGGLDPERIEVIPDLEEALDRGLALTPPGGVLPVLPTYTAMLALRGIAVSRGHARPYWEKAAS